MCDYYYTPATLDQILEQCVASCLEQIRQNPNCTPEEIASYFLHQVETDIILENFNKSKASKKIRQIDKIPVSCLAEILTHMYTIRHITKSKNQTHTASTLYLYLPEEHRWSNARQDFYKIIVRFDRQITIRTMSNIMFHLAMTAEEYDPEKDPQI